MERFLQLFDELEDIRVWLALRGPRLGRLALTLTIGAAPAALLVRPAVWPAVVLLLLLGAAAARRHRRDLTRASLQEHAGLVSILPAP